jgi:rhodanese-related sulfurtransferase
MRAAIVFLFVLFTLFLAAPAFAAAGEDIPRMSIEDLKTLMDNGADILIVDTQTKGVYGEGHIKRAFSLPSKLNLSADDVEQFPINQTVILYCNCGPGETDSARMGEQLLGLGFTDVKVLKDPSIEGWKKAGYPIEK